MPLAYNIFNCYINTCHEISNIFCEVILLIDSGNGSPRFLLVCISLHLPDTLMFIEYKTDQGINICSFEGDFPNCSPSSTFNVLLVRLRVLLGTFLLT